MTDDLRDQALIRLSSSCDTYLVLLRAGAPSDQLHRIAEVVQERAATVVSALASGQSAILQLKDAGITPGIREQMLDTAPEPPPMTEYQEAQADLEAIGMIANERGWAIVIIDSLGGGDVTIESVQHTLKGIRRHLRDAGWDVTFRVERRSDASQ